MLQLIQQHWPQILFVVLLTSVLSFVLIPFAYKISLIDKPSTRKIHQNDTAPIGGICILLACGLSLIVFDDLRGHDLRALFFFGSLFLVLGVLDDYFDLRASVKLLTQVTISFMFLASTGLKISTFGSLFGLSYPIELGFLSTPFTILAIVGLTNAFNMIDGCDGLAASLVTLALLGLLYFGSSHLEFSMQFFLLTLVASVVVFLVFNFSNNPRLKIFLGDGGSMFLGFVVSGFLVKFAESNTTYNPSLVLWLVAVPIFDFLAVVARRLLLKIKIMSADNSHLHNYFLSLDLSHFQTTMIILVMAIALLCLGGFLEVHVPSLSLFAFIGLFTIYLLLKLITNGKQ